MDQVMWDQIERYLRHLENDLSSSPNTVAAYRNDLTQFYQYLLTVPISGLGDGAIRGADSAGDWREVSRARLIGFVVALKEKGYATTTVARKIAALKSFFHFLNTSGVIDGDPTERLDSPRIDKVPPRGLSTTEVAGLLEQPTASSSPDDLRDHAMLRLLILAAYG